MVINGGGGQMEEVGFGGVYKWDRGGKVFNWDVLVAHWFSVGG